MDNIRIIRTGINVSKILKQLQDNPNDWESQKKMEGVESLLDRGLTEDEAKQFTPLLEKLTPTQEDIDAFYREMEQGIPFEGGMCFTEALTGLKESLLSSWNLTQ
mgnify:CR=1 FL=1